MVLYPLRGKLRLAGQVALVAIATMVAAGLVAVPTGGGRAIGAAAAVALLALAAWLVRGMRRQALAVDGSRLGWRRGLTDHVGGWTALESVEAATTAKLSSNVSLRHTDLVLWTRTGGMRGLDGLLLRWQLPADRRRRLDDEAGPTAADEPLHPFLVPLTALQPDDRASVLDLLDGYGLLQPPTNSSA